MKKKYRYLFQWATGPKDVSVVGNSVGDVYRQAAKLWMPAASKLDLDECVKFMKDAGGRVRRLYREDIA